MFSDLTIRAANLADIEGIARVHVDTWRTTYRGIVPDDFLEKLSYERRAAQWQSVIERASPREHLLVAVEPGDKVIGFSSGGANRSKEFLLEGELYAIYLLKEHQGQGIGRCLFEASVDRLAADGFKSMILWVLEENATCRFYERMGGTICGEKLEDIGGKSLKELAYSWETLAASGAY